MKYWGTHLICVMLNVNIQIYVHFHETGNWSNINTDIPMDYFMQFIIPFYTHKLLCWFMSLWLLNQIR